jgi:DNA-binding transcriptional LysR family regulator
MTLDQIITLDNIVKYGSFKMASQKMFKSQPSLSMAIKKLEDEYGIQLFDRDGYRPILTKEGEAFYAKAQILIGQYYELETLAKELSIGVETSINICIDAIFPLNKISDVLSQFFTPTSATTLNLEIDVLEGLERRLQKEEVDFAIGPNMRTGFEIEAIPFLEAFIVPVISSRHLDRINGNVDALKTIPQIVVSSSSKKDKKNISNSLNNNFLFTSDMYTKEQLITSGLGWGNLPFNQAEPKIEAGEIAIIPGIPQLQSQKFAMYLLRKKSKILGPKAKKLWNELIKLTTI